MNFQLGYKFVHGFGGNFGNKYQTPDDYILFDTSIAFLKCCHKEIIKKLLMYTKFSKITLFQYAFVVVKNKNVLVIIKNFHLCLHIISALIKGIISSFRLNIIVKEIRLNLNVIRE